MKQKKFLFLPLILILGILCGILLAGMVQADGGCTFETITVTNCPTDVQWGFYNSTNDLLISQGDTVSDSVYLKITNGTGRIVTFSLSIINDLGGGRYESLPHNDSINALTEYNLELGSFSDGTATISLTFDPSDSITLHSNFGTDNTTNLYITATTFTLGAHTFIREGYFFTGWNSLEDGSGAAYNCNESIEYTESIPSDLYAQWEQVQLFTAGAGHGVNNFASFLKGELLAHENPIKFQYKGTGTYEKIDLGLIWTTSTAHDANTPNAGDYIISHVTGQVSQADSYTDSTGIWYYDVTFEIRDPKNDTRIGYLSTLQQENDVDAKITQIFSELGISSISDPYEKFCAIYDYLIENVEYDYENKEADFSHTAYAALCTGKSVCQGYASALYRMLLKAGINNRIITGTGNNGSGSEPHAWNIVELDDLFYNVDATWDSSGVKVLKSDGSTIDHIERPLNYCLKGKNNTVFNTAHTRGSEYDSAFEAAHVMSLYDHAMFKSHALVLSGQIGMCFKMLIPVSVTEGNMSFTVGSRTCDADVKNLGNDLYQFSCYITSVEMGEEIVATYTYTENGKSHSLTDNISVKNYLETIIDNVDNRTDYANAKSLSVAVYNYGYYAMKAVDDGSKHPALLDKYLSGTGYTLNTELTGYPVTMTRGSDITSASYSLDLDSETAINFYLTTETVLSTDNVSVTPLTEISFEYSVEKVGDRYRVQITGIGAHELGVEFTITTGSTVIKGSALSYVQKCLANTEARQVTKDAAAALYAYYMAAKDYIS